MRRIAMQLHKNNDVDIGQSKVSISSSYHETSEQLRQRRRKL